MVGIGKTTGSSLRLRSNPSLDASVITMLDKDWIIAVLGEADGWYHVAHNGDDGYVSADFFKRPALFLLACQGPVQPDGGDVHRRVEAVLFAFLHHPVPGFQIRVRELKLDGDLGGQVQVLLLLRLQHLHHDNIFFSHRALTLITMLFLAITAFAADGDPLVVGIGKTTGSSLRLPYSRRHIVR